MATSTVSRQSRLSLPAAVFSAVLLFSAHMAFAASSLPISVTIQGITQSQPPRLLGDVVLFAYKPGEAVRFVGARFAHEDYAILHPYSRNENGVFVLDYPLTEGVTEIRYRMVVDGLWMNDPSNPDTVTDSLGNLISLYTLETRPSFPVVNPKLEPGNRVTFEYHSLEGQRVTIVGDFNDWNPYADPLTEVRPGIFRITLHVLPGSHYYLFFTQGHASMDPYNSQRGIDPDGNPVSYFRLP